VASIWVESLSVNFQAALDLLESAIRDCTDELWQANMWNVPVRGEPAELRALIQRMGQPWGVAWHALEILDFKLTGGTVPWGREPETWPRFGGKGIDDITTLSGPWSQEDLLGYIEYCRQRVVDALRMLTDERAATLIGRRAEPYVARLMRTQDHVIEHASQIRQFITSMTEAGR
jgi:hypothetical protein